MDVTVNTLQIGLAARGLLGVGSQCGASKEGTLSLSTQEVSEWGRKIELESVLEKKNQSGKNG